MKFDSNLQERLTPAIIRRAGYGVAKNIPKILEDIERNINESGENTLIVTLKLKFEAINHKNINVKTAVGWVRKTTFTDSDIEDLNIDLHQPELPFTKPVEVVKWDDAHEDMQNIIAYSLANRLKLIRVKNIADDDCCQVQTYKEGIWQDHLLESPREVEAVLLAVAEDGGMAYKGRSLINAENFEEPGEPSLSLMPIIGTYEKG